eukprot:INCI3212.2.p1 GENE.INCI3212.2~~INCI3212.2.p1  ORF type:complete len:760 (-),score=148.21 INCI3212.2:58-2337(-)
MINIGGSASSTISAAQLQRYLKTVGIVTDADTIAALFEQVDADSNGKMSLAEFTKFFFGDRKHTGTDYYDRHATDHIHEAKMANIRRYEPSAQLAREPLQVFRERIEKLKDRSSGSRLAFEKLLKLRPTGIGKADYNKITRNEFITIMLRMQVAVPIKDLHGIFDTLDMNKDGELGFEEFLNFFDPDANAEQARNAGRTGKKMAQQRPSSAFESKTPAASDGAADGLLTTIIRALERDFFGNFQKMQGILKSLKPGQLISVKAFSAMLKVLHVNAHAAVVARVHDRVLSRMRSRTDHRSFLPELLHAAGTDFETLAAAARKDAVLRPPSSAGIRASTSSSKRRAKHPKKDLLTASAAMPPAKLLKGLIVAAPGGYRNTMIRMITNIKQTCRYHDSSKKLARSDITCRGLTKCVQDAGVIVPLSTIQQLFSALDAKSTGRISCAKFLRVLKMATAAAGSAGGAAGPHTDADSAQVAASSSKSNPSASSEVVAQVEAGGAAPPPGPARLATPAARKTHDIFGPPDDLAAPQGRATPPVAAHHSTAPWATGGMTARSSANGRPASAGVPASHHSRRSKATRPTTGYISVERLLAQQRLMRDNRSKNAGSQVADALSGPDKDRGAAARKHAKARAAAAHSNPNRPAPRPAPFALHDSPAQGGGRGRKVRKGRLARQHARQEGQPNAEGQSRAGAQASAPQVQTLDFLSTTKDKKRRSNKQRAKLIQEAALRAQQEKLKKRHAEVVAQLKAKKGSATYVQRKKH